MGRGEGTRRQAATAWRRLPPGGFAVVRQVTRWIDAALLGVSTASLACLLVIVVLQVVFRSLLQLPLAWSDEVAVYLFIWGSLLAAAVAVGDGIHFSITCFADLLSPRGRRLLDVGITLLCMGFSGMVVWQGYRWSWRTWTDSSPALELPQGMVYAAIPFAACYMLVHLAIRLRRLCAQRES